MRRHTTNPCQAKIEAQKAPDQKELASGTQIGTVMTLSSRVTAAFNANSRPSTVAPVFAVMESEAKTVPAKSAYVPIVAELPTCQKTWQA